MENPFNNGYIHVSHQLIFESGAYRIEPPKTEAGVREIPMTEFALKAIKEEIQNMAKNRDLSPADLQKLI